MATDEELAAIRAHMEERPLIVFDDMGAADRDRVRQAFRDRCALLAEVERLRAENAALKEAQEVDPDFWAPHPPPSTTRRVVMIARAGGEGSPSTFVDDAAESIQPSGLVDALEAENAALREIAEAVAGIDPGRVNGENGCMFCDQSENFHTDDCPVTKARARLGKE